MPKSKKRTKKYDPSRWLRVTTNGIERRMDQKPLQSDRATTIAIGHHIAFDLMMRKPSDESWYELAAPLNMALVLCERGFGPEYEGEIKSAMLGMMRARYRADRAGVLALDGDAIKSIRTALELHDEQLKVANRSELRAAAKTIVARVENGDAYAECEIGEAA